MSGARTETTGSRLRGMLIGWWLIMGVVFHVIYFGLPNPLAVLFWLHVVFWPAFVLLGLLRWFFLPFAVVSLLALGGIVLLRRL